MRIVFWGKGARATSCLEAILAAGYSIDLVVAHPPEEGSGARAVSDLATHKGIECIAPVDPNTKEVNDILRSYDADIFVLGGYGKILKSSTISIPRMMCINLHGGRLPCYRGSSPLNWSLINGERSFGLSIIKVDEGVDTGDILEERVFDIEPEHDIRHLHEIANVEFPKMLVEVIAKFASGTIVPRKQSPIDAAYYPLRFPDDGMILWDTLTAEQIHNQIRALTSPYPCAFSFYERRRIRFLRSELHEGRYFGTPGRIYKKTQKGILVCASDRCLWITEAEFEDPSLRFQDEVRTYGSFATIRGSILELYGRRIDPDAGS